MTRTLLALILSVVLAACGSKSNPSEINITDTWIGTTNTDLGGDQLTTFVLTMDGEEVNGTIEISKEGDTATAPISGTFIAADLTAQAAVSYADEEGNVEDWAYTYSGSLLGNSLTGSVTLEVGDVREEGFFEVFREATGD